MTHSHPPRHAETLVPLCQLLHPGGTVTATSAQQPPLSPCALLPAGHSGEGDAGQVPTRTPSETYLSIIQPSVIQSSTTLEKANLN